MNRMLCIESAAQGLLYVNGQMLGPLEADGQSFALGRNAEAFIQLFPFAADAYPMTVRMELRGGEIARLEPKDCAYALLWPDGVVQLELRAPGQETQRETQTDGVLLRYLRARLSGDARAASLFLRAQDEPELPDAYMAAVPLRFAPLGAPAQYDERAGLMRRVGENVGVIDAALAKTVPAGQGHRLIERFELIKTRI